MNELVLKNNSTPLVEGNQPLNGSANVIIYVILGIFLALIIGWLIWKIVKKQVVKKKELKERNKKQIEAQKKYYEYILSIWEIIDYTNKELDKFVVSIGDIKMIQIKDGARKLIKKLIVRDDFAETFVNNPQYETFVNNVERLCVENCNLWKNKINDILVFFEEQYKAVPDSERKFEYLELVRKSIEEQFYA
ncbi:Uncharacterised protein [Metamycoplasma cloacale]|uniref:Uncharacterized protein n=1 Tax=Metamycoplasma cloacale TaxID=92401 RepID=A0A2Z4LM28_9BACT|nr:hypothetical protein [Metamycoplasma cloacale]AWX42805.1 hypothetical protein DK849_01870 [Metamycoplasma cloacale]VEU79376.1 Uncharacterised protein [Metamycoplasma cloacale]